MKIKIWFDVSGYGDMTNFGYENNLMHCRISSPLFNGYKLYCFECDIPDMAVGEKIEGKLEEVKT